MAQKTILYGGYGANRDLSMLQAITGNDRLKPIPAVFHDVELGVQRFDQVSDKLSATAPLPFTPKELIINSWGRESTFETYVIRRKKGSRVNGCVFELTPLERALIAEWEMIEFGWYKRMHLKATLETGEEKEIETEGFDGSEEIDRVVDGLNYPTYLNEKEDMLKAAENVRKEYLKRP